MHRRITMVIPNLVFVREPIQYVCMYVCIYVWLKVLEYKEPNYTMRKQIWDNFLRG